MAVSSRSRSNVSIVFTTSIVKSTLTIPLLFLFNSLSIYSKRQWIKDGRRQVATARFVAAAIASWFSFKLLNRPRVYTNVERSTPIGKSSVIGVDRRADTPVDDQKVDRCYQSDALAGRTMDLTILAATRAVDAVIGDIWACHKNTRVLSGKWNRYESVASRFADAGVFVVGAGAVMWAWFYAPERLPRAYNKWIGEAAQVDTRLVETLRKARKGQWVYGHDTGEAHLLQSMCMDYGWPLVWGDPSKTYIWGLDPAVTGMQL
ncbi:hypothetical protein MMC20_004128 [Loxospora ochrophaea]|nr:hypothetical protein [Loxospora ochrophaea]